MLLYLRDQRRRYALILLWGCILLLVYGLYGLPWGPVLYSLLLMAAALLLHEGMQYGRYAKRMRALCLTRDRTEDAPLELPQPGGELEAVYQALLRREAEARGRERETTQDAARAASRYYTRWSHQAKTPLAALRLLLQEEEPDRGAMEQALFQAEQYVDMALQYQRLRGDSRDLLLEERELGALVRQAVKKTAPLFIHKGVQLELGPLSGNVLTDEKWLVFVLEQLLTNAVKYTPPGGRVTVGQPAEDQAALTIADTGIGIRPEDLPRVFEWGYTGENGRRGGRSTGIGLALCKQAMDLLGHGVSLRSQPGAGTTAMLDLSRHRLELD